MCYNNVGDTNLRMFREFKDAEDAENANEREAAAAFGALAVAFRLLYHEDDEVRKDGQHVDDVHHVTTEIPFWWTRRKPDEKLDREPSYASLPAHETIRTEFLDS